MKKRILLSLLFIGPLAFFIFLSLGEVNFKPCEIYSKSIIDIPTLSSNNTVAFADKISIVHFLGTNPASKDTQTFNINEVVFKKLAKYKKFQMITFYVNSNNSEVQDLQKRLTKTAGDKFYKWKFVCLDSLKTKRLYNALKSNQKLDVNFASNSAFIIDKNRNQRGRTDDDKIGEQVFEYNMLKVNDLKNKLLTDTQNVIYEQEVSTSSRNERLNPNEK